MSSDIEQQSKQELEQKEVQPNKTLDTFRKILRSIGSVIMKINRKVRIVLTIFAITFAFIYVLVALRPEAQKRAIPETVVKVEVVTATPSDYPIVVNTSGTIQADTRGNLVSQIRGEIVRVSDTFKTGGAFKKNDVLIEVDQRDYLAAQSQAAATVSQAEAAYRQEQANSKQAIRDWQRLGNSGTPPDLVARKPQLEAARAQLDSALANLETAKLNLERTKIKAPYQGRVIRRDAVLGQYVSVGTVLAEVFATDEVEVRLPLSQDEFAQLGLDSLLGTEQGKQFAVVISTEVGGHRYTWDARVTRTDSTFDLSTRQIDVIASVIAPFDTENQKPPLKIGQFVTARIQGRTVNNAIVIPNKALREGSYVFVSQDLRLQRKPVKVIWQDDQNALIESGIESGDLVVTTSLNSTLAGAKVKLSESVANGTGSPSLTLEDTQILQAEVSDEIPDNKLPSTESEISAPAELAPTSITPADNQADSQPAELRNTPVESTESPTADAIEPIENSAAATEGGNASANN
ncbi:efflux RND transporter periplasmic adaptor subunit [Arenicella xantha]|uniref:RND family efflux transporter MFP subunit n=1 Tax=Arenicella xantha TaxID=644221 RepID=A0A395JKG5_9GAMM|nr:efflux RND transporter periplasmic adaptor subunit [Arenicella xantha]RBP49691.1 RND family efflux transporter MFP subunit [Arenicella xantha]